MATRRYANNLTDAVCEDDRAWFEQHPDAPYRFRPCVPGEIVPPGLANYEMQLQCECGPPVGVLVQPVAPDARTRRPMYAHDRPKSALTCAGRVRAAVTPRA